MKYAMMKYWAIFLAVLLLCPLCVAAEETDDHPSVCITVQGYGDVYAELYPEYAPITVENFLKLVDQHFYDGLTFHRIIYGFMIQGGDPLGNGTGGSPDKIKGEFSANGVENPLNHERGILSMARSQNMDSASSQFFIMHDEAPHLDGSYAAFGQVKAGMWIVDRICQETPVQDNNGTVAKEDQPVIESIRRANGQEIREAYEQEKKNGAGGSVFNDPVTPLSFRVPDGWNLIENGPNYLGFLHGNADSDDQVWLTVTRSNQWDRLSAAYRAQLEANGYHQRDLGTEMFNRSGLIASTGQDEALFADETHSGVLFYTAEGQVNGQAITYYIGAKDGYVYSFIFDAGKDDALYRDLLSILDQLIFREEF